MATLAELKARPDFKPRPPRPGADEQDRNGRENLKRLAEAGVLVAAGTDAGNIGTLHAASIFRELRLMVAAGMSPAQVLVAATRNGARVMGRERELGTLEPGKLADLLLLAKDPLTDISNLETIDEVVKGGRRFEPAELARAAGVGAVEGR